MYTYFISKHFLSSGAIQHINFEDFYANLKRMINERKVRIVKLVHLWLPKRAQKPQICQSSKWLSALIWTPLSISYCDLYSKTKMPTPTTKEWLLWRKTIHHTFTIPKSNYLKKAPSRKWRKKNIRSRRWICNIFCQDQTPIYIQHHHTLYLFTHIHRRTVSFIPTNDIHAHKFQSVFAIKRKNDTRMWYSSTQYIFRVDPQTLPKYDDLTTDASVRYGEAVFGAICNLNNPLTTFCGRIRGTPNTMNYFRAEAGGVSMMVLRENMRPKKFYCDNKALIEKFNSDTPFHPLSPDWEFV